MSDVEETLGLLGGVTGGNGALDSGTVRDDLIRVDRQISLLAIGEAGHELGDTGNAVEAMDMDDLVELVRRSRSRGGPSRRAQECSGRNHEARTSEVSKSIPS